VTAVIEQKMAQKIAMPIRAIPYRHQNEAFNFVCEKFGLVSGGDENEHFQKSRSSFTDGNGLTMALAKPSLP